MVKKDIILINHYDKELTDKVESFRNRLEKKQFKLISTRQGVMESEVVSGAPLITQELFDHMNYAATLMFDILDLIVKIGGIGTLAYQLNHFIKKTKKITTKDILLIHEVVRSDNFPLHICFVFNHNMDDSEQILAISQMPNIVKLIEKKLTEYKSFEIISIHYEPHYKDWDLDNIKIYTRNYGTSSWHVARVNKEYGFAPEKAMPYNPNQSFWESIHQEIPENVSEIALKVKPSYYQRLYSVDEIRMALKFTPVVICVKIYKNFIKPLKGVVDLPLSTEKKIGNHCVLIASCTEDGFKFINSWGQEWGDDGYGYVSFAYIEKYLIEAWGAAMNLEEPSREKILEVSKFKDLNGFLINYELKSVPPIAFDRGGFFVLNIFNVYNRDKYDGWAHFSYDQSKEKIEIEELFIISGCRGRGFGSSLLSRIEVFAKENRVKKIVGWASVEDASNDIIEDRLVNFFINNGYICIEDDSKFIGALLRFEKFLDIQY